MSEGKVIINKLHRFLRQRSVPASTVSTGGSQEEAVMTNNNLKVQIISNSEGSSPMKEMSPNGEISLLNEKNDLTKNLLLATDIDGSVGILRYFLFSILISDCMALSKITNIYHRSYPSCCCFFTIFCSFSLFLVLHRPRLL